MQVVAPSPSLTSIFAGSSLASSCARVTDWTPTRSCRSPFPPCRAFLLLLGAWCALRPGLDDLVLRVGNPLVVHAQELAYKGLPDLVQVPNGEFALVELTVSQSLLDYLADHRPYCGLIATRK